MDSANEVIQYIEELARVMRSFGVSNQFHILVSGGAYMLLQQSRRATQDVDFALIAQPGGGLLPNEVFQASVQRAEVSKRSSRVPNAQEFRQAVAVVAASFGLDGDWMNDESAVYLYDDAPQADAYFWQSFGNVLYVYLPTREYVFALKMAAFRAKDLADINVLVSELGLRTRAEAQTILDKFLLPESQKFWQVGKKLKRVFRS